MFRAFIIALAVATIPAFSVDKGRPDQEPPMDDPIQQQKGGDETPVDQNDPTKQHNAVKMPRIIVIKSQLDGKGEESKAIVIMSDFDKQVTDQTSAQELVAGLDEKDAVEIDVNQLDDQSPDLVKQLFAVQNAIADALPSDDSWARARGWSNHHGWRGGYSWYGHGRHGTYGYYNRYPRYSHSNYGFYFRGGLYPYYNIGYSYGYPGYRYYYYYNPYYRW